MPLQQINVSPFKPKENDDPCKEERVSVRPSKGKELYGMGGSQSSSQTSSGSEICRICHCEGDMEGGFISPCYCSGSLRFVHQNCLQQWIKSSGIRCCELCKFQFIMQTKTKPFMEWEPLEMSEFERKKLFCAVLFQLIAIFCVVWTLYALVNGTAEEMNEGVMEWTYWAKMIIVTLAFIGGIFFMYVQCRSYLQICQRWRAYNKIIYIQNVPEKQPMDLEVPSSCESSTSQCHLPKSRQSVENDGNVRNETSINLKGVRNTHLFYNDECRLYLNSGDRESEESLVGLPPFLKLCRALGLT